MFASEPLRAYPPLEAGKGRVFIYRSSMIGGEFSSPEALLNGAKVGKLNRRVVYFRDVPPGSYAVTTTLTSAVVHFSMREGEKKYVRLNSSLLQSKLLPEIVDPAAGEAETAGLPRVF